MSKNGLILTSLVTAIPGALMAYLMVMAFVNYAGGPTVLTKILCVLALLVGLLLFATPIGIFVLAGPKTEKAPAKMKKEDEAEELVEVESGDAVEVEDDGSVTDENLEVEEGPPDEFAVTGEVVTDDLADSSEFDIDEVDEESPKKGKK